jgi:hypothetical protein
MLHIDTHLLRVLYYFPVRIDTHTLGILYFFTTTLQGAYVRRHARVDA